MPPWNSARTKVQIKLSIQRLRTLQEKKLALAKKSRREIADLLLKSRVETARLRVEGLIGDDIYVELLELLELYSETLNARFNLLDASSGTEPEASISDAVCAIVYAAPRTELKELQVLREMLMHKYGRQWSLTIVPVEPSATAPPSVPARIVSKLALYTPARELVDAYLYEIAKGYGVNWIPDPPAQEAEEGLGGEEEKEASHDTGAAGAGAGGAGGSGERRGSGGSDDEDRSGGGDIKTAQPVPVPAKTTKEKKEDSPDSASPKTATTSYPAGQEKDAWAGTTPPTGIGAGAGGSGGGRKLTAEEELAKRFERLKNLK